MKIIVQGKIPDKKIAWPVGYCFDCRNCKSIFEIESGDVITVSTERRPNGVSTLDVECPVCNEYLTFKAVNGVLV